MPGTLSEYTQEEDWGDLSNEQKINVLMTYVIDLENEVYE